MAKFKEGDKVKMVTAENSKHVGRTGVVMCDPNPHIQPLQYSVRLDEPDTEKITHTSQTKDERLKVGDDEKVFEFPGQTHTFEQSVQVCLGAVQEDWMEPVAKEKKASTK